tara:strand:+ start:66 stop:473 length:408 start_codon:yes stop_codon:yes gene_type:complete
MTTRFETQSDLTREENAIKILCEQSNAKYEKLGENDVDFKITKDEKTYYAEVKGRNRTLENCYPLPVAARKIVKLCDTKAPIIIWDCEDAIIYGNVNKLQATGRTGGRTPREGSTNDIEFMLYFDKQQELKTILK